MNRNEYHATLLRMLTDFVKLYEDAGIRYYIADGVSFSNRATSGIVIAVPTT